MEEIALFVFLSIIVVVLIYLFYLLFRNNKVLNFRYLIIEGSYNYVKNFIDTDRYDTVQEYDEHEHQYRRLMDKAHNTINKYSYDKMLFSFKPLKLEKWFSSEEIEFITKYPPQE